MVLNKRLIFVVTVVSIFCGIVHAAQPPAPPQPPAGRGVFGGGRMLGGYGQPIQLSSGMQHLMQQDMVLDMIKNVKYEHGATHDPAEKRYLSDMLTGLQKQLGTIQKQDDIEAKLGRAIASGLAGTGKELDEQFDNILDGAKYGALMRMSKDCGDVLSKRLQGTSEHVLGGIWDFVIGSCVNAWTKSQNFLFHKNHEPFTPKELRGWQELIKTAFDDVERLVKDGVKDSLRGHDMSLRKIEDGSEEAQEAPKRSLWRLLVAGYIRQLDFFVSIIDERLGYYNVSEKSIVFFATELKHLLLEFMTVLNDCVTIKDLDAVLESSKWLIPAMRKDINVLLVRLMEQVEPKSYTLGKETITPFKDTNARKDTDGGMDAYPRAMNGAWD